MRSKLLLLLLAINVMAQQEEIEDAAISVEAGALDWTTYTQQLAYWKKHPMDLNKADVQSLLLLPGMNEVLVRNLKKHIERYGPLLSVYELQAVPGFTPEVIHKLLPYVTVKPATVYDWRSGEHWSRVPSWEQWKEGRWQWWLRGSTTLQPAKGFVVDSGGFLGNPWRYYQRLIYRNAARVQWGIIMEKDPGEPQQWSTEQRYYGWDFISPHFYLWDWGRVRKLVIGNYTIQWGEGLLLSRGFGFGRGVQPVNSIKAPPLGIRPYTAVNEYAYLSGAATTIGITKQWYLSAGISQKYLSASQRGDTTEGISYALLNTGYHNTPTLLKQRKRLKEQLWIGRLAWKPNAFHEVGWIFLGVNYGDSIAPSSLQPYQRFDFRGKEQRFASMYWRTLIGNFHFFGEGALQQGGGWAAIAGIQWVPDHAIATALHIRYFSKDFQSPYGYAFARRPYALQAEQGIFWALQWQIAPYWYIESFWDQYRYLWYRYRQDGLSEGNEQFIQLHYKPNKTLHLQWRFRYLKEERNLPSALRTGPWNVLRPFRRYRARIQLRYKPSLGVTLTSRLEGVWYHQQAWQQGMLAYQEVRFPLHKTIHLSLRYTFFAIPSYDARIYTYELDVPTSFSIPAFYGKGYKLLLLLRFRWRAFTFWLRLAHTVWSDRETIGSGLYQINDNALTQMKLQLRWQF